jgi:predicted ribosome quality control (RQC) complex YloA/Tae2 family protein
MYFDALTLSAVRDELAELLMDGRVQRVVHPTELSLGLEVYAGERYQLLISAEPQEAHIVLAEEKLRRGIETATPLQMLLRKYVRGARLREISQPPFERVLRLTFQGEFGFVDLVCEIMGRMSNVILVDSDDIVMDSLKRIPSTINRYRTILPQEPYVAPPPQDKEHPLLLTPGRLEQQMEEQNGSTWRRLLRAVTGISPLLAREMMFRATGEINPERPLADEQYERLVTVIATLMTKPETHAWWPCVAYEEGRQEPTAYAAYELTHLPEVQPVESISSAILAVAEAKAAFDPYVQVRDRLHDVVRNQRERLEGRLQSLRASQVDPEDVERLQVEGTAILTMAWSIEPGQQELVVDPVELGLVEEDSAVAQTMHIDLDPGLSPADNAQKRFERYRKLQAAAEQVPRRIRQTKVELEYLEQLNTEIDLAQDRGQLDEVEAELIEAGFSPKKKRRSSAPRSEPISVYAPDGTLILVGRNSRQNAEITFHQASQNDTWLHAHGIPGSHVIIKNAGAELSEETLELGARLAAYYSAARQENRVQVDYAERRYVRAIRGAGPGMVTYTHEETMVVPPKVDPDLLD